MPTGILSVKLGRPLQMPTKRLHSLLEQARRDCCKTRNAAILHWYVWRRAHPDWQPGGEYKAPELKIRRKPKPPKNGKQPKDSPIGPRPFFNRELNHVARDAAPKLAASIASSCVQDVISRLKANTPYDHDGDARWVWQAILAHEVNLSTWRGGRIPAPYATIKLTYNDHECTLRFPLLSEKSGYRTLSPVVRLHAADLTRGNRRLLRELADGTRRLAGSQITERKGKWFADLCYEVPAAACDLPADRVLTLGPAGEEDDWPFLLSWVVENGGVAKWRVGKARPLIAEYRRVVARRRAIRYRYSDGCGKGHGRQRWYKSIRPMQRATRDMQARFAKQTISDIIKFAISHGCGGLLYREPTSVVRQYEYFVKREMPFDWTAFELRLKFKAECHGLAYEKKRIGMQEWRPKEKGNTRSTATSAASR